MEIERKHAIKQFGGNRDEQETWDPASEPEQIWDSSDRAVEGYKPLYRIDYEEPKDH